MNYRKNKTIFNKKNLFILVLMIGAIIFVYGRNLKSVSADEEITVCSLDKMVTVGSLIDQTLISVTDIIAEVDKILNESELASQTAAALIQTSAEDCQSSNCNPECQPGTELDHCAGYPNPGTNCSVGYVCTEPSPRGYFLRGDEVSDPVKDCQNLPNAPDPISSRYYAVFDWKNIWSGYFGICVVDWTCEVPICTANACSGEACPFGAIAGLVGSISDNRKAIETAHENIEDFFEKERGKFLKPDTFTIFGNFCQHPIISEHCSCDFGLGKCDSEFDALMILHEQAINNIKKCDIIRPDDLLQDLQGEILFRCKDVTPSPIEQCWRDDFFCCSADL